MAWSPDPHALRGRVAVVAGATRGAGRGIAAALGEAGATVVCTGRTSRTGALQSDYVRSETIEETAELVTQLGGTGIGTFNEYMNWGLVSLRLLDYAPKDEQAKMIASVTGTMIRILARAAAAY